MKTIFFLSLLTFFLFLNTNLFAVRLIAIKSFHHAQAPKSVEISPNGHYAAVMNIEGMNIWVINTKSFIKSKIIQFFPRKAWGWSYKNRHRIRSYAQKPVECDFSSNGRFIWTSLHNDGSIVVYDTRNKIKANKLDKFEKVLIKTSAKKTRTIIRIKKIKTGKTPKVVKVTPNGKYVLVSNWHSNTISIIDARKYKLIKNIRVGRIPRGIAISPDSNRAYVANMGAGSLSFIDLKRLRLIKTRRITSNPRHLKISNNGRYLYISDNANGLVLKYDLRKQRIVRKRYVGRQARTLTLSHDGKYVFVTAYRSHRIVVLNSANLKIVHSKKFYNPIGVSITPDDRQIWVTSYGGMKVTAFRFVK